MKNINNQKEKGITLLSLMSVVGIIAVLITISMPLYNKYIETTKVSKEPAVIGNYKNGIANCFMLTNDYEGCNEGTNGIPEGIENEGDIIELGVENGNITLVVDAKNHKGNITPIELRYVIRESQHPSDSTLDWNLFCSDLNLSTESLVNGCDGTIDGGGEPTQWLDIDPVWTPWVLDEMDFGDWTPSTGSQTNDFQQERQADRLEVRDRKEREQNVLTDEIRIVEIIEENRRIEGGEERIVNVDEDNWVDSSSLYNCNNWGPTNYSGRRSDFVQTRECSLDQTKTYTYTVNGEQIGTYQDSKTINENESRNVNVSNSGWNIIQTGIDCRGYSPSPSTVDEGETFTQYGTCDRREEQTWYYRINGSTVATDSERRTRSYQDSRQATGTKYVAPPKECKASVSGGNYYLVINRRFSAGGDEVYYSWNGSEFHRNDYSGGSYTRNGYRYTQGSYLTTDRNTGVDRTYYGICREEI